MFASPQSILNKWSLLKMNEKFQSLWNNGQKYDTYF